MNRKYVACSVFALLFLGGCQIRLLPELTPARKMLPNFEVETFERVCDVEGKTIYLSGVIVPEPFHGRKIMLELDNGEVEQVRSMEWAGQFERLFKNSFERGLRKAFVSYPEIVFLSEESSAETDLELGIKVVRIKKSTTADTQPSLSMEMVTRVSDLKTGRDYYHVWVKSLHLHGESDEELVHALKDLVSEISKEIYTALKHNVCSGENHWEMDILADPSWTSG
jgi:uncharacterized lipoprotein YmbA